MRKAPNRQKDPLRNFIFIISLIKESSPRYLFAKIISAIAQVISSFILILFPKYIIDSILEQHDYQYTLKVILFMCTVQLLVMAIRTYTDTYINKYSGLIQFDLVKIYGKKVMELNYEDLENPNIMNMFEKSKSGFDLYDFFDKLMSVATNMISLLGYIIILLTYNWIVLMVVLAVVAINLFCNKKKNQYYYKMSEAAAPLNRKFSYLATLMLGFDYAKEIKVNNLSEFIIEKYDSNIGSFRKLLSKLYRILLGYNIVTSATSLLQTFALYAIVAFSAVRGTISIGDFSMYTTAISATSASLIGIVVALVEIGQNMKYATDMRLFFELDRKVQHIDSPHEINHKKVDIVFENVSFRYPGTDRWILKKINFSVCHGEKISLVGKNGAGKTTIIKLLLRLYDPTEGRILMNGVDIREYNYAEYLDAFAPVLQDYKIFAFTCQENIVLNRAFDRKKMDHAIIESGLGDKIHNLPDGAGTSVYKLFDEHGIEFSGGENQKLAIARAIYKNSPIVLLDEPTANLDPIAEYDIYEKMFNLLKEKTCFFVSHRLASSRVCNRIFVIDNGQLVADGAHKQLVNECELYREMYEKQAQFYVE